MPGKTTPHISLIIPVLEEQARINTMVKQVRDSASCPVEIIVADGDPEGSTLAAVDDPEVVKVKAPKGRARQMNAGAALARGEVLLFVHADTELPPNWCELVRRAVMERGADAGAFSLGFDTDRFAFRLIAATANLRTRLEHVPYGDQAHFFRAATFRDLGGYPDIPIMEDVEIFHEIKRRRLPVTVLKEQVRTSPRRWETQGVLRRTLGNWWLRLRHAMGEPPEKLVKDYRPQHEVEDE